MLNRSQILSLAAVAAIGTVCLLVIGRRQPRTVAVQG